MKKINYLFTAIATAIVILILTRFGHFKIDGSSLWQAGLWLILVPTVYGLITFGYMSYIEAKNGGWTGYEYEADGIRQKLTVDNKPVKIYQANYFLFTVMCFFAVIGEFIVVLAGK
jgi:hypothetical protein